MPRAHEPADLGADPDGGWDRGDLLFLAAIALFALGLALAFFVKS